MLAASNLKAFTAALTNGALWLSPSSRAMVNRVLVAEWRKHLPVLRVCLAGVSGLCSVLRVCLAGVSVVLTCGRKERKCGSRGPLLLLDVACHSAESCYANASV